MIIIHIAYITCLVTNDAVHAYNVIGVYKIRRELGGSHISLKRHYCGWLARLWARSGSVAFNGASNTVVGYDCNGRGRGP